MRLIPVQITAHNLPISVPLRNYISEKLGSVARSGGDVLGIAMGLRASADRGGERYIASGLVFLSGRRIYCSASDPDLLRAVGKLGKELTRLARERQRARPADHPDPVHEAAMSAVLQTIDSRIGRIFSPPAPSRSAGRAGPPPDLPRERQRELPQLHRIAVPATCA